MFIKIDGLESEEVQQTVRTSANKFGVRATFECNDRGRYVYFGLAPVFHSKYTRRDVYGNPTDFVCWHGIEAVLCDLFQFHPDAIIEMDTPRGRYRFYGSDEFNSRLSELRKLPVGWLRSPTPWVQMCKCEWGKMLDLTGGLTG